MLGRCAGDARGLRPDRAHRPDRQHGAGDAARAERARRWWCGRSIATAAAAIIRLLACDCTALAPTLLESELFGHVKGSFSGAIATKKGLFEVAHQGTLFLDEVANLSLETQGKLLRVLETRQVRKVGDTAEHEVDIRLIATTNRSLAEMVKAGAFRADLYYRLNVVPISLPPLARAAGRHPPAGRRLPGAVLAADGRGSRGFSARPCGRWRSTPGRATSASCGTSSSVWPCSTAARGSSCRHLPCGDPRGQVRACPTAEVPRTWEEFKSLKRQIVEDLERRFLIAALDRCAQNITQAAESVGMQRPNFHALLRQSRAEAGGRAGPRHRDGTGRHRCMKSHTSYDLSYTLRRSASACRVISMRAARQLSRSLTCLTATRGCAVFIAWRRAPGSSARHAACSVRGPAFLGVRVSEWHDCVRSPPASSRSTHVRAVSRGVSSYGRPFCAECSGLHSTQGEQAMADNRTCWWSTTRKSCAKPVGGSFRGKDSRSRSTPTPGRVSTGPPKRTTGSSCWTSRCPTWTGSSSWNSCARRSPTCRC